MLLLLCDKAASRVRSNSPRTCLHALCQHEDAGLHACRQFMLAKLPACSTSLLAAGLYSHAQGAAVFSNAAVHIMSLVFPVAVCSTLDIYS